MAENIRLKKLHTLILCLLGANLWSQNIDIVLSNPLPRVGQEFEIKFEIDFMNDLLLSTLDQTFEVSDTKFSNIKIKLTASDTGQYLVGPYSFEFGDSIINSDSISVRVLPELEKKPGVWVNKYISDNKEYIILEEISYTKWINTKKKGIESHKLDMPKQDQAKLLNDNENNIGFHLAHSKYLPYYESKMKDYSEKVLYYSRDVYFVRNPNKREIKISEDQIKNCPENIHICF